MAASTERYRSPKRPKANILHRRYQCPLNSIHCAYQRSLVHKRCGHGALAPLPGMLRPYAMFSVYNRRYNDRQDTFSAYVQSLT